MGVVNPSTFTILTYRPFEPTEISGIKGWWKADSIAQADGSSVSAWLDSSGNEAHMYQSSATAQPTLQTNELNGYPVVRFDGTNDFMNLTAPFDVQPTNRSDFHSNSFSKTGNYLIHSNLSTAPQIFIYKKNGNNFNKLSNPVTLPVGTAYGTAWTSDDLYLAIASSASPRIQIYKRSDDTFTKLSNPATLPSSSAIDCDFSSDNTYLAVTGQMTGLMIVYKRSGDTFTALTNPTITPLGTSAEAVKFSLDTNYLAIGSNASPFIQVYSRSGDVFTKLTNPTTLPSDPVYAIDWIDNNTFVMSANSSTTRVYSFDSVSGTFQQVQTIVNTGTVTYSMSLSNDKNYLALGINVSPFLKIYSRNSLTFTALSNSESLPLGSVRGISFNPTNNFLITSHGNAPYIQAYTFDGTTLTNLTKLNMFRNVGGGTVFQVIKYDITAAYSQNGFVASMGTNANASRVLTGWQSASGKPYVGGRRLDANSFQNVLATTTASSIFYMQTALINYSNSDASVFINGKLENTNTSFQTDGLTSDTNSLGIYLGNVGNTEWLKGDIAEVITYNRVLTTAEIRNVHYYLSAKYNITLAT
jgi:6-phosphogluconolactonase (cycloisomerase 2 family)